MAKTKEKSKAVRLRRKGMSIKTIAQALQVSKGSVSVWCQSVRLTSTQSQKLRKAQIAAGNKGRMIGAEMNKQKRLLNIDTQEKIARKLIGRLTRRDKLMLGIALYWGEGIKAPGGATAIVNSDPDAILFARNWFEQLGVTRDMFRPYIFISEIHKSRESVIVSFWSALLSIPKGQFAKVVFLKGRPKKIYENHNSYYGVLTLRIRKGTTLKYRVLGLIQACKEEAGVAQVVRASHS